MTFDEVMDTWRTQEKAPLYGVNRDLLQLVLQHEQSTLRRGFRTEAWIFNISYTGFFIGAVLFFLMIYMERHYGDEPRQFWGYPLAAAAAALSLGSGITQWVIRRRQALRERSFGNTLRDELQRHLSLLDHALSRRGRAKQALLDIAPMGVLAMMTTVLAAVVNGLAINPLRIMWKIIWIAVIFSIVASLSSQSVVKALQPRRERLAALLKQLDIGN
jgi:hypothetical protein